jgi:DNA-binding beta-propeller fold protein YncE
MQQTLCPAMLLFWLLLASHPSGAQSGYKPSQVFHLPGSADWDYLTVDETSNKLYVTHWTRVDIRNKFTGDSIGVIPNTTGVHGVALAPAFGKGYTSNGQLNNTTVFDLATAGIITRVATGQGPDAIFYDDYSRKVVICNGDGKSLSVIDPVKDQVVATVLLPGKPETAVSDGAGRIFVNLEDKSSIAVVDAGKYTVVSEWPLTPGKTPHGLAIDRKTMRLFAGCQNQQLIVMDANNGKIAAAPVIGNGSDGVAFDSSSHYIYSSNGEGTLTVIEEISKDDYKVLEQISTRPGARTLAVDRLTHRVYLPFAEMIGTPKQGEWPDFKDGTFQVLVLGKNSKN